MLVIFGKSDCPYTQRALHLGRKHFRTVIYHDIDQEKIPEEKMEEMKKKLGTTTIPIIFIDTRSRSRTAIDDAHVQGYAMHQEMCVSYVGGYTELKNLLECKEIQKDGQVSFPCLQRTMTCGAKGILYQ